MRIWPAALVASLGMVWAAPARAQSASVPIGSAQATTFWSGVSPRNITFKPIDTTQFYKQHNLTQYMRTPAPSRAFSLTSIFHPFSAPSWPPKIGQSQAPPQRNVQPFNFPQQQ